MLLPQLSAMPQASLRRQGQWQLLHPPEEDAVQLHPARRARTLSRRCPPHRRGCWTCISVAETRRCASWSSGGAGRGPIPSMVGLAEFSSFRILCPFPLRPGSCDNRVRRSRAHPSRLNPVEGRALILHISAASPQGNRDYQRSIVKCQRVAQARETLAARPRWRYVVSTEPAP